MSVLTRFFIGLEVFNMKYKRTHFIKADNNWIAYFCDTVTYKRISAEEKECYE